MLIKIDERLEAIGKNRNWLSRVTGYTYANTVRLCNGKSGSLNFAMMERMCKALDCKLDDIFILEGNEDIFQYEYFRKPRAVKADSHKGKQVQKVSEEDVKKLYDSFVSVISENYELIPKDKNKDNGGE